MNKENYQLKTCLPFIVKYALILCPKTAYFYYRFITKVSKACPTDGKQRHHNGGNTNPTKCEKSRTMRERDE